MHAEPPDATTRDRRLIDLVIQGEAEALDTWYRREHPHVFRVALGFLARWEEAEDLSQDAMLHLLDHLDAWDQKRPFRAWRNTVVANLCRDRLRRIAARGKAEKGAGAQPPQQRLPTPVDHADQGEIRSILIEALGELTDREREVFVLRDLEGCPASEAAVALDIGESTVRSLLSLARRRLRKLLGPRLAGQVEG